MWYGVVALVGNARPSVVQASQADEAATLLQNLTKVIEDSWREGTEGMDQEDVVGIKNEIDKLHVTMNGRNETNADFVYPNGSLYYDVNESEYAIIVQRDRPITNEDIVSDRVSKLRLQASLKRVSASLRKI